MATRLSYKGLPLSVLVSQQVCIFLPRIKGLATDAKYVATKEKSRDSQSGNRYSAKQHIQRNSFEQV